MSSNPSWHGRPVVVDTSAWVRARHQEVRGAWTEALLDRALCLAGPTRLEILFSARDGNQALQLDEDLSLLRYVPLTDSAVRAAVRTMLELAQRSAGAQRLPIVDYLVCAAAQDATLPVLHYDHDFDVLGDAMGVESLWLAPAGSL